MICVESRARESLRRILHGENTAHNMVHCWAEIDGCPQILKKTAESSTFVSSPKARLANCKFLTPRGRGNGACDKRCRVEYFVQCLKLTIACIGKDFSNEAMRNNYLFTQTSLVLTPFETEPEHRTRKIEPEK
jgi:hypothetical protein